MTQTATVSDNEARHRYEITVDGHVAGYAEYQDVAGARMMPHTEITEGHEGEGLGSQLVKFALDDIRAKGLQVVPMCPFVASYMREHREYTDLVQPGQRGVFGL
ncbi:GNAT family N-acetyltransferase [Deinococcus sp.]|uniref:GNAT family N-acetyltransferase n=1 Tax=Deinococcus sp. TaxID=47478 RepID=UPI0028698E13|nr:GNAT family N-acetyltransferase [Deinococcus sp.]